MEFQPQPSCCHHELPFLIFHMPTFPMTNQTASTEKKEEEEEIIHHHLAKARRDDHNINL
jgi:hypothetical protein